MVNCASCNTLILFGGTRGPGGTYCNQSCMEKAALLESVEIPNEVLNEHLFAIHSGPCPVCNGPGPVDVHLTHFVWSVVFLTRSTSKPALSCRSCARKSQAFASVGSLLVGWWGIPWGLVWTPVQVGRNIAAILRSGNSQIPSEELENMVRIRLVQLALEAGQEPVVSERGSVSDGLWLDQAAEGRIQPRSTQ